MREAILAACLKNVAFDPQGEGSRATYLLELADLGDVVPQLADSLGTALAEATDDHDLEQRFELARLLAERGVPFMREAMYSAQRSQIERWLGGESEALPSNAPARELIALDGLAAVPHVFAELGRAAMEDEDFWDDGQLLQDLEQLADADEIRCMLSEARATDERVDAYLRAVDRHEADINDLPVSSEWPATWAEARERIEHDVRGTGRLGFISWRWGGQAALDQLALAAQALVELPRSDIELLRPYLCVFLKRDFPLDAAPLIEMVDDTRESVAWFALNALERLQDARVRRLALRMAGTGRLPGRALSLLAKNWESGDEQPRRRSDAG